MVLSGNPEAFFFNDTATTEIYTLSLHDALPILKPQTPGRFFGSTFQIWLSAVLSCTTTPVAANSSAKTPMMLETMPCADRKSTRLNSSHANISYAVFCLKKTDTQLHLPLLYLHH